LRGRFGALGAKSLGTAQIPTLQGSWELRGSAEAAKDRVVFEALARIEGVADPDLSRTSAQLFGIQLEVETWRWPDGPEVVGLATLPEAHPVRIVLSFRIAAGTDLRIDVQVDG
jgi:hypothetical protein